MEQQIEKTNIYSYTLVELGQKFVELGLAKYLAKQVYGWLYRFYENDIANWSNVSKGNKELLKMHFDFDLPQILWSGLSKDGTRKFLLKMIDGQTVEAVAIPARDRLSLCVSSQVGCAVGCTFCHTATQGLKRHLKSHEVVGEFVAVTAWLKKNVGPEIKFTNMVYMGQGEPLHNFENMKKATTIFLETDGIGLGQRRITLSTSGLVPQIEKLIEFPPVNIAISLHSARNEMRTELMPINKVYDLQKLFTAIKTIPLKAYRRITYEYLLIDGFNNLPEDVEALSQLIKRAESKINLIPFNEFPGSKYKRPSPEAVIDFQNALIAKGFTCTVRATKGDDILAACGQLKTQYEKLNLWNQAPAAEAISLQT
jgi:23S rRNA (adenine2503-C2)-methyltransferase